MTDQTFITGKDAALEESIASMSQKLKNIDIHIEEASWLNPVPNVYSVHIRDTDCGLMFTNGKGATKKACLASALGEYFERLSCNYFFADFYLGSNVNKLGYAHYPNEQWIDPNDKDFRQKVLSDDLWAFYDPEGELKNQQLFDFNSGLHEKGICCLPYQQVRSETDVLFPVNVIANCYVSNGMSAGNTRYEARVQALSEIFERYAKNKIIAEAISLPDIPQSVLDRFPSIQKSVTALEKHGFHIKLSDASLGGQFPVICVTLINPINATVFSSYGAHPCFEVALERTVTELLQGRDLNQLDIFLSPSTDYDEVADPHNLETHFIDSSGLIHIDFFKQQADYEFADWDHSASTEEQYQQLIAQIHKMGFDVYISDYQHLNVYACRVLVPGMSEIYPVDDLVWNNNNEGVQYRERILSLDTLDHNQLNQLYEDLNEQAFSDYQKICEFIGIAPDKDTVWSELRIGELKALLCLAMDHEDKAEWVEWCISIDQLSPKRHQLYHCLDLLLKLDETSHFSTVMQQMYGDDIHQQALNLLQQTDNFSGLHFPGLSLDGFNLHNKLLQGYAKLNAQK